MKKIIIFVTQVIGLTILSSIIYGCEEEKIAEARYLELESPSTQAITVPGEGGEFDLVVHSNLQWTVSAEADEATAKWISFSSSSGIGDDTVTATVLKGSYDPRTATVTVMSKDETISYSITVNQESTGEEPAAEGYNLPAYSILKNISDNDVSLGIANANVEGGTCKFDDGASFTMIGENASAVFYAAGYYQLNARFTGWDGAGTEGIVAAIPVKEPLSGDFRMFWGWTSSPSSDWKVSVSADGENYTDTGAKISMSTSSRFNRTIFFSVPETIPAGGTLYLKLIPETSIGADGYVQLCNGFLLTRSTPDPSNLPSGDKILYTCDFNNVVDGCPYDLPLGYLRSSSVAFDPSAVGYDGMSKSGTVAGEWGSVRIGSASAVGGLTFPALSDEKLGNGTADVKVSFKTVLYQSADYLTDTEGKASCRIKVSVAEGEGTVEDDVITEGVNWETFVEKSVTIRGVNKDTRIKIASEGGSGDRRFYLDDVVVEAISDIVIPSETPKTLTEVLEYESGTVSEAIKTTVTVVSDPSGANLPENTAIITDGTSYAALSISSASKLTAGTKITLKLKGATLDKTSATITASAEMITETEDGTAPAAETVTLAQLPSCEYHLVEVKNVQATDAFVGKTFSGEVTMENDEKATFGLYLYPSANFAGSEIPGYSGSVKGIVIGGKVCPRTAADINLVLDRMGSGEETKAFTPVFCTYEYTPGSAEISGLKNVTVSGSSVVFNNGGLIEKVGGTEGEMSFGYGNSNAYNVYMYSTGWDADGTYYRLSVPMKEDVSGKVAVTFSLNSSTKEVQQKWNIFWGTDGENWTETEYTWNTVNNTNELATAAKNTFTAQSSTSKGITRTEFTVPASKKIAAGEKLYIKLVPTTTITAAATKVQIGFGFFVAPGDIANTEEPAGALVFNNFSECAAGTDYMLGPEVRYFGNCSTPAYAKDGWTVTSGYNRMGYTMFGGASTSNHGITTSALSGISGTADVTVTFKCCLYMPSTLNGAKDDICVKVAEGEGTVGELTWDTELESDYYNWHTATVKITGATAATRIFIGAGAGKVDSGDRRCFLDDIIVK
ncbi:MAG: DUF5689 domain-containing protein [Candidatus Cryptobacteroides sp.]